ncbi:MAG: hypothetical protein ABFD54_05005 [Armatimonadota bacterium]|nr:phage protease [bacterium]
MTNTIERDAKLFEAGSYPDRGIDISEEDLDRIIEGSGEAPIRIEHTATPFDGAMGVLKSVYRKGKELFGRLCFTQAAWELIQSANAKRLSVAIKKDKSGIAEVSLVREPRIADAAVFSEGNTVSLDGVELGDVLFSGEEPEVVRLRNELAEKDSQSAIDELKRAGKLAPAAEVFARALLRSGDDSVITFGNAPTPVSQVFRWFLESQPKVIEFSELAPASEGEDEEPEVFAKLGVTSRQVEKYRGR